MVVAVPEGLPLAVTLTYGLFIFHASYSEIFLVHYSWFLFSFLFQSFIFNEEDDARQGSGKTSDRFAKPNLHMTQYIYIHIYIIDFFIFFFSGETALIL